MQKGLEKWTGIAAAVVTIVGFPLLLGSLWFAFRLDTVISEQLGEIKRIAQSQNGIALNTMLFNDSSSAGIISSIQNNKPILVENGGSYSQRGPRQISRCVQYGCAGVPRRIHQR
jgi:hypothetical protein